MPVAGKRFQVGTAPVDVAEGTALSGVQVYALTNSGDSVLWVGDGPGLGYPLGPGQTFPGSITLGSTDPLLLSREDGEGPVDVMLGWS